ncbi:MAG TPA: AsmA-like C-terminal domain-containing protein, partial [Rhizomicrobium sp.]|nr:AsmA-like C-terminal domain-containing protein [Rhizomicrobium sp.]
LNGKSQPSKGPLTEPFHISAKLDHVVLREGVNIAPFAVDVSGVGDRPQVLSMSGTMKSATLGANLATDNGTRQIKFNTNDAGQLIKGMFGLTSIHGGNMDVAVQLSPPPGKNATPIDYTGSIVIRDFKVTNQPFLARLFSAASIIGFVDLLRGQGISVDRLQVPFTMHGGVLDIHDARATGPSLGITADGYLDRRSNQIALEGALAPLSTINSVLGAIPLVGDVLVSKKGEGVIGMSYAVNGDADEPKISVNPLSVLTPGIFRRIFEGTPHAPPAEANTNPAQPKGP